jgi:putative MATE family efflux protein
VKDFDRELVSGSIPRSVWKLAWPVITLNLVNGLHGFVDHLLVGRYCGGPENAGNAAIGVAWQVFLVLVVFIASVFHGMNVLIARYAGRRDRENMSRVAWEAFLASVFILFGLLAPAGYFIAPHLVRFVRAEPAVAESALPYLRILFTCGAPLFLMFMLTGAFQASGDPKTPLKLGVLTTALNIALSFVLITGAGPFPELGVSGAAIGTVLAPVVSVFIALRLIFRRRMILHPPAKYTLIPDFRVLGVITRIGLPTGTQAVLLNLGGVFLFRYIGSMDHSAAAQAAYTICYAQLFSIITWPSFGLRAAASTLMGQNIGAGAAARGRQGVSLAAGMGLVWAAAAGACFWLFSRELLSLFGAGEDPVLSLGRSLLHFLSGSGVVLAVTLALTGGLQGAGETRVPMVIAFITQILVLLGLCQFFLMRGALTVERIWLFIFISHSIRLVLTAGFFYGTERWMHRDARIHD